MKRDLAHFRAAYHSSAADYDHTAHLTTCGGEMPWISAGSGEEWVFIDLGEVSAIESVSVRWGGECAANYEIELSNDGEAWTSAVDASGIPEGIVETAVNRDGRYVRVHCRK